jgi:hypothetical protein
MDAATLSNRIKNRVAELESAGKKVPAVVKRYIRQGPKHAYRNDTLEKIARGLEWSVAELVEGVWRRGEEVSVYGLERHLACLQILRTLRWPRATSSSDARELEWDVTRLYLVWCDLERKSGQFIDEATFRAVLAQSPAVFDALLEAAKKWMPPDQEFKVA